MPDGRIEPRQVEVLKEIGQWVRTNEEAIYGTRGGPYLPTDNLASTHKGKNFYLFVMDGSTEITLPGIPGVVITKAEVLGDGQVKFSQKLNVWKFEVAGDNLSEEGYVINVKTKRALSDIEPVEL